MRWANVWTIFRREVRDQSRDRRTLFMVFVLPILLYPVLGIGMVQLFVAFEEKPRQVVVLGAQHLPTSPALLSPDRDGFDPGLTEGTSLGGRLRVRLEPDNSPWANPKARKIGISEGGADAVLVIPPDVKDQLGKDRSARLPIDYVSTDERSQVTYLRVREILANWNERIVKDRLVRDHKSSEYNEAVRSSGTDLATRAEAGGNVWGKIFPFLLIIMALTGAFYPAIDICAGEKERGTMETLLISPASRSEIVLGKFFTVVLASMMTATLNLASMAVTGIQLARQLGAGGGMMAASLAPPTAAAAFWMLLLLVPLAIFFAAICLALAVLARSMKEGQYYMTPLYMVCLPLILLTLAPGVELTPFYSMVPLTGVGLLLRSLIQGDYGVARRYFLPVLVPMVIYGIVALRWAVDQFRREDVLFRESERFELGAWLRHLIRDKGETPGGGMALLCFTLMLCLAWFALQTIGVFVSPLVGMGLGHLVFILLPPVAMALVLTSDPAKTLRLALPGWRYVWIALGLALTLNPIVRELGSLVERVFPPSAAVSAQVEAMMKSIPNVWVGILLFALIPSITEEVAFRGFILSGLERGHSSRTAILISALLFGFLHVLLSLFNQLFPATLLGLVLGLMAVRSRSLLPGILFHFLNNALAVLTSAWAARPDSLVAAWALRDAGRGLYRWPIVVGAAVAAAWLLVALYRSRGRKPREPIEPEFRGMGEIPAADVAHA